jgi:hypothetical protein
MSQPTTASLHLSDNNDAASIRRAHNSFISLCGAAPQKVKTLIERRYLPSFVFFELPVVAKTVRGNNGKKTPLSESIVTLVSSANKKKKFEVRAMLDLAIRLAVVVPVIISKILTSIIADAKEVEAHISNHHLSPGLLFCYMDHYALREVRCISHHHLAGLSHLLELASYLLDTKASDFRENCVSFLSLAKKTSSVTAYQQQDPVSIIHDAVGFFSGRVSPNVLPHCSHLFDDVSALVSKCLLVEKLTPAGNSSCSKLPCDKENNTSIIPHRATINSWMHAVGNLVSVCGQLAYAPTMYLEEILVSDTNRQEIPVSDMNCQESFSSIQCNVTHPPTPSAKKPALAGTRCDAKKQDVIPPKKPVPNWVPPKAAKPEENDIWFNYCRATSNQLPTKDQIPPNSVYFPCNACDKVRVCQDSALAKSFILGDPDDYGRRPVEITIRQKVPGLRQYNPFIKHREHVKDCARKRTGWVKIKGKSDKDKPKVPNKDLPSFYTDTRSAEDDEGATKEERQMKKKQNEKLVKQRIDEIMFLLAENPRCVELLGLTMSDIPQRYLNKASDT